MYIVTQYQVSALGPLVLNYYQWFRRRTCCRNISSKDGGCVILSLQCYSVLSTIAQVLRKINLKILVSCFWMPHLSQNFESYQRVKIYAYSVNDLGLKNFSQ